MVGFDPVASGEPLSRMQSPQADRWVDEEISSLLQTVERGAVLDAATTEDPPAPLHAVPGVDRAPRRRWLGSLTRGARSGRRAIRERRFELALLVFAAACAGAIAWLVTLLAGP
jgi:hypothetical protein